jgi:hypothetical protein
MNLRGRITEALKPLVREFAPGCLVDLWGRDSITVLLPALTVAPVAGRPEPGRPWVGVTGQVRLLLNADTADELPDERLWAALAAVHIAPDPGAMRLHKLTLTGVAEQISGEGWATQELTFDLSADLAGVATE